MRAHGSVTGNLAVRHALSPGRDPVPGSITIRDRTRITDVLGAAISYLSAATARCPGALDLRLAPTRIDEERDVVTWFTTGSVPEPPFWIEVPGYNCIHHVPVTTARVADRELITDLPTRIVCTHARAHRRVDAPPSWRLRFVSKPTGSIAIRPLLDLSWQGLAFHADTTDRIALDAPLDDAWLLVDDTPVVALSIDIRHVSRMTGGYRCGGLVTPRSAASRTSWSERILRLLHPSTRVGSESDRMWELFRESGYFDLSGKSPVAFVDLRARFTAVVGKLARATDLGHYAVWPQDDDLAAVVSALRIYSGTYFASQMAKRPGTAVGAASRRDVLRDIQLHAYEHAWRDPSCRWVITYVHEDARLNYLMCAAFAERHHGTPQGWRGVAHVYESTCRSAGGEVDAELDIREPTPDERAHLVAELARRCPAPYVEALDLVPSRIDLATIRTIAANADLLRDRRLVVARRAGVIVAAAVLDVSSDGHHLFGLLDTARVFAFDGASECALRGLLDAARRFYSGHGKTRFVIAKDGPWSPSVVPDDHVSDLGSAVMTIFSSAVMPEWFEHIYEQLAPRR